MRYGWDGVYDEAVKNGYTRSFSGMVYAGKRMGLGNKLASKNRRERHGITEKLSEAIETINVIFMIGNIS